MTFFGIKGASFAYFLTKRWICANFFSGYSLGENSCSLQPALKSTAPSLSRSASLLQAFGKIDLIKMVSKSIDKTIDLIKRVSESLKLT